MRTLIGLGLVAIGASQLLLASGLVEARMADLWPVGAIALGLWLVVSGLRRPDRGGLAVGVLALTLAGYHLGREHLAWPDGLYLPVVLIALGLGVLVGSKLQPKTA